MESTASLELPRKFVNDWHLSEKNIVQYVTFGPFNRKNDFIFIDGAMFDWIGVLDWITYAIVLPKKEYVAKFG